MVEKMLPLLSDGLRLIVENIRDKHSGCDIAKELLLADDLINDYNKYVDTHFEMEKEPAILMVVREKIDTLINDEARMLSFRHNAFEISFLPKGKQPIYVDNHTWSRDNRQISKPARLIQKLLIREYKCKEFEDFNNWIKNEMITAGEFVLVEGEDITKYYNQDNYIECKGTLGNSCMRYSECKKYFKVYEDHAKMLICRKNDKILGRAIVWELPEGTFMDRIYTCYDYLESQFIDYAEKQKWYHRAHNTLLSDDEFQEWYGPDSNYTEIEIPTLVIKLKENYTYMPYMDSFRYYDHHDNTISTDPGYGTCYLSNTDGSYGDVTYYTCECCGCEERGYDDHAPEGFHWSEWDECWYCDECAVYCDGIDDYISRDTSTINVYDRDGHYYTFPESYILDCRSKYVIIDNEWYHKDCPLIKYNEELDSYELKK